MTDWLRLLTILSVIMLMGGCAHKYSEEEYRALELKLTQCGQEAQQASEEHQKIRDQLTQLKNEAQKAHEEKEACLNEMQSSLDKSIQALEQNKSLLQQITHFKTIMQERKDTQGRLSKIYNDAMTMLYNERLADQLYIIKSNERIRIVIPQRVLFANPRSAWLTPKGSKLVEKIATVIKNMNPAFIEIGGHTDSAPLSETIRKTYPNNWYLSHARAIAVLNVLEKNGLRKDSLSAIAYADTRPIADNNTEEGMSMNRRVEITIMP